MVRRSTRTSNVAEDEKPAAVPTPEATTSDLTPASAEARDDSKCPLCVGTELNAVEKEKWILCDACKTWYHWRCAGNDEDLDSIDKWFCKSCLEADPKRAITTKLPARKSDRKRTQLHDYANLHAGISDPYRWLRIIEDRDIKKDSFKRMKGEDVNLEWLEEDENAMREPIIIESPENLGMKMPNQDFTVEEVAELVGEETPVEVIDVASQSTSPGWNLGKWADYYALEPQARDKILNVISLEVSGTPLANKILPPRLVQKLDWVENCWPSTRKGKGHVYPKVQLYCLMGVAKAWTDWHIDFAGSSVYYHIINGSKIFYFIRPTPANLAAYEKWSGTELQEHSWLGDMVDEVVKVELTTGNTMLIPSGWIHAVYTPVDTLVFGGNFLHSYDVPTQLKIRQIEIATQVPRKFRFPLFSKLSWYVADKALRDWKTTCNASPRVINGLVALADFLVSEIRILERGTEQAKNEVKDQIPTERVKDPAALARELRWRANLAAGNHSEDEAPVKPALNGHRGVKRRRVESETPSMDPERPKFKNFKPKRWDRVTEELGENEDRSVKTRRPIDLEVWNMDQEGDEVAQVKSRRNILIKLRETPQGLERERIERVVEQWTWPE
ncbi:jumonji superfamily protein [Mycena floridula]|nr:jumonji superfamily protein [Mycena floridula]